MGRRPPALATALIAWSGTLVAGAVACTSTDQRPASVQRGDAWPLEWSGRRCPMQLVWAGRPEDCMSCAVPVPELRRLANQHRSVLELVAVAVGDRSRYVDRYLRVQRLPATTVSLSKATYRARFGRTSLPMLYLVGDGASVLGMWRQSDAAEAALRIDSILQAASPGVAADVACINSPL